MSVASIVNHNLRYSTNRDTQNSLVRLGTLLETIFVILLVKVFQLGVVYNCQYIFDDVYDSPALNYTHLSATRVPAQNPGWERKMIFIKKKTQNTIRDYSQGKVRGPKSLNFPDGNFQRAKTFRAECVNRFRDKKTRKSFSRQKKRA